VIVHHEVAGPADAPALILSSSLGTTAAMWEPQLAELTMRFRVITYDTRGHGRSPVPAPPYEIADLVADVLALLDHLGEDRVHFCGLSLGGMIGLGLALAAPERLDRLVLFCTSAYAPPPPAWAVRAAAVRAAGSTVSVADALVARWLTPDYAQAHPDVRDRLHAMLVAQPTEGYAACCGAIERMDQRAELSDIAAPTLVVGAREDLSLPAAQHSAPLAAAIAGARYELIDGAHLATVEHPTVTNRLIIDHLEAT
jgi:3-oxoadipate enol-lactonase